MWTEQVDLHSHSTHSDGEHAVELVAQLMGDNGVKVWSLTDHDTMSGWREGAEAARLQSIRFIPGIEITCQPALPGDALELERQGRDRASASWHLLAYFPSHDPLDSKDDVAALRTWLEPLQGGREPRMRQMCKALEQLGMPVDVDSVLAKAEGSVGRPHLALAMIEAGYVQNKNEAFEEWIGDGKPAFIPHSKPTLNEAISAVKAAGGFTSLAHPLYYGISPDTLLNCLAEHGVDAVEAVHRSHPDQYRHALQIAAEEHGLKVTVGSDFHGLSSSQRPGHMPVMKLALHESIMNE